MSISALMGLGAQIARQAHEATHNPEHATTSGPQTPAVQQNFDASLAAARAAVTGTANPEPYQYAALQAETSAKMTKTVPVGEDVHEMLAEIGGSYGGIEVNSAGDPVYQEPNTSHEADFVVNTNDGGQLMYVHDLNTVGERPDPENSYLTPLANKATLAMNGRVDPNLHNFQPTDDDMPVHGQLVGVVSPDGTAQGGFVYISPEEVQQQNDPLARVPQLAA